MATYGLHKITLSNRNMDRVIDEKFMRRCLQLARCGFRGVSPNPMVGAVVVHDGRIIGEGYHMRCGGPHAEVNAISAVADKTLLPQSTVYVSLEPCSHYGKTPPCADLLVRCSVKRVVAGCIDPFSKVQGRGVARLREAGIEVTVGVLESECLELNRRFVTFNRYGRPYVTLKWAQSSNGYIAAAGSARTIISTPLTQMNAHRLRTMNQAILVGRRTAESDNPSLTARVWHGSSPLRVVIDHGAQLLPTLNIFNGEAPTLAVTVGPYSQMRPLTETFCPDWQSPLVPQILAELHRRGIQTLLVEGGACTLQQFIDLGLWDEAVVEHGRAPVEGRVAAPAMPPHLQWESRTFMGGNFSVARNSESRGILGI